MPQTLYFLKTQFQVAAATGLQETSMTTFGVQPRVPEHRTVPRRISLKRDLGWAEVRNLQGVMRSADFWESFPELDVHLITAEFQPGTQRQRIDLLYLRADGGVFPCELKIGAYDDGSVGQLIRYLADLDAQAISREWVLRKHRQYLRRKHLRQERRLQHVKVDLAQFADAIAPIPDPTLARSTGIIVDEGFPPSVTSSVSFLNRRFGFNIRLFRVDAYVSQDWVITQPSYAMRIEFNEVET
jgi:hypothetical protein